MTAGVAAGRLLRWAATGGELLLVIWAVPFAVLLAGLPVVGAIWLVLTLAAALFGR